jgi:hypothetical protein
MRLINSFLTKLQLSKDETNYLSDNCDVLQAVQMGNFNSGYEHYVRHGRFEGREWRRTKLNHNTKLVSETISRNAFGKLIMNSSKGKILEIGPLNMPIVEGSQCAYFDILSTLDLRKKALGAGLDPSTVPNIDYFHATGDLSIIPEKFDSIVSAHCIEHQADLIEHLKQVSSLLSEHGKYFLVIPDQRYCFDHFLPPSRILEIIRANTENRKMPTSQSIIEHHAFVTHNDPVRHWKGDHGSVTENISEKWKSANDLVLRSKDEYIDVHCWQFQPEMFKEVISNLYDLGYISFRCVKVFPTEKNNLEFFAILEKS